MSVPRPSNSQPVDRTLAMLDALDQRASDMLDSLAGITARTNQIAVRLTPNQAPASAQSTPGNRSHEQTNRNQPQPEQKFQQSIPALRPAAGPLASYAPTVAPPGAVLDEPSPNEDAKHHSDRLKFLARLVDQCESLKKKANNKDQSALDALKVRCWNMGQLLPNQAGGESLESLAISYGEIDDRISKTSQSQNPSSSAPATSEPNQIPKPEVCSFLAGFHDFVDRAQSILSDKKIDSWYVYPNYGTMSGRIKTRGRDDFHAKLIGILVKKTSPNQFSVEYVLQEILKNNSPSHILLRYTPGGQERLAEMKGNALEDCLGQLSRAGYLAENQVATIAVNKNQYYTTEEAIVEDVFKNTPFDPDEHAWIFWGKPQTQTDILSFFFSYRSEDGRDILHKPLQYQLVKQGNDIIGQITVNGQKFNVSNVCKHLTSGLFIGLEPSEKRAQYHTRVGELLAERGALKEFCDKFLQPKASRSRYF